MSCAGLGGAVFGGMCFLQFCLWNGSYHRKKPLYRSHRQPTGRGRGYNHRIGEVGRVQRDDPLDTRLEPHDGGPSDDLLHGYTH